jgi:glycosyltransferase involved in cell wall biosynthesis
MLRNRIYYQLKPFIPQALRTMVRRSVAQRLEERVHDIWPITPGSEKTPQGWPGWPDGSKFTVVLTHDVEGRAGLRRCRDVMRLEAELGFRSCFNLIPEGNYTVSPELRDELTRNGFEVGVHDLRHDGRLYRSRRDFSEKAKRINHYLNDWNAVGFRSGFMLHNLDWLHELDIQYDMSTFDTDPFEPQPEGWHTIFPFFVPISNTDHGDSSQRRRGYVELPYTLPQDSTLFLLLRQRSIDIWVRKLDWIAANGGMALVNVHPDYLQFDYESKSSRTYPAAFYQEFLHYLRRRYGNGFWQPLPKELSTFIAQLPTVPVRPRPKRVCMVTHSFYASDNRVTRYAQALVARGDHVDVLALRRSPELAKEQIIDGVHVFRIQDRLSKTERSKLAYLWPLLRFLALSALWVTRRHAKKPYDLLHIHNIPDFMVFSAWYPKMTGAKIILDIHDIVPEFFASKFGADSRSALFSLLRWMERVSAAIADHVIIGNHLWLDKYAARTRTRGRCTPFINNVDSHVFIPRPRKRQDGKLIILFPGGLQWHQGVDIAILAFSRVRAALANAEFHIYGDGSAKESLVALAAKLQLNGSVRFFKTTTVRKIAAVMADADLGVVPKRADSFGNEAYSTKIMEFMAVGVPVVVSSTKVDRFYFDESVVRFFESGDPDALAREIIELLRNFELRRQLITRASEYAARNCWDNRKADYLNLVDCLCADMPASETPQVEGSAGRNTTVRHANSQFTG